MRIIRRPSSFIRRPSCARPRFIWDCRKDAIEPVAEFQAWVDTPEGDVPVLLASFAGIDPPFAAAERTKSRFIAMTESRQLSEVERNLLRRAYEHVLG
ncbi:MAG: hypothetical protein IPJ38_10185 [Dechloromonas sp.]|uniref:Uncharacterized protein n=1 Tax=Candidatus Dechloromonas phosphorivorans TaxID=2899244 RepID=A0A935JY90_9RHOO|nr:hypothetical protein [Candidatus Dechloromonas phosphorivorans]